MNPSKSPMMLDHVLGYAARGWCVFPVRVFKGDDGKANKKPLTTHGHNDSTTDKLQIEQWQHLFAPTAWGVDCGRSNIVVIDVDNVSALETLPLPPTLAQKTGSGGYHYIYQAREGVEIRNSASKLARGVDVRGVGGWIVIAPSAYVDGKQYAWIDEHAEITPLPDWLVKALTFDKNKTLAATPSQIDKSKEQTHAQSIANKQIARVSMAQEGARNDTLYRASFTIGGLVASGAINDSVEQNLSRAAVAAGLSEQEIERTVKSGINSGKARPFTPTPSTPKYHARHNGNEQPNTKERAQVAGNGKPTDDELRDRWIANATPTKYGIGEFRRYAAGYWAAVPLDTIRAEILAVLEQAKGEGIKPTKNLLASVLELARVKLFIRNETWDADPDLLVCANGALRLSTRELLAHSPEHYATSALSYAYDATARAEWWEWFMASTIPDATAFVQEFFGYALTTDTKHETALWLQGEAGSGKSTCLLGAQVMLGNRACGLGLADIERSRFALANLPGKTLAVATEQPSIYITASHVLNALISGEPVSVERKYFDPVTFTPRVKVAWAMNEMPRVNDASNGLFRRVKVVHFPPRPEGERDPDVKLNIEREGAGILNWALDGLARLKARGRFDVPQGVKEATEHFRTTNDVPALFVADECMTGNDAMGEPFTVTSSALYTAYREWCIANGHKPQSSTSIAEDLKRLGFEKYASSGVRKWRGIGLKSPSE